MTKKLLAFAVATVLCAGVMAQTVEEGTAKIGELTVPSYTVTLEKGAKLVQSAMNQRLKDAKLKTKNVDGYVACLQQVFAEVAATPINLYTKVEDQGRKGNKTTVVTVCALSQDLTIDQVAMNNNLRLFVSAFPQYVDRYEALTQLSAAQDDLKKAQKAQKSAASDLASVEKNIGKAQQKAADKQKEIEKLTAKIASLEKEVNSLQADAEKYAGKKAAAEEKLQKADEAVKTAQEAVDRYSLMAQ